MSPHVVAALIVAAFVVVAGVCEWVNRGQRELDRHIREALAVGNAPDLGANVAAFDGMGRSATR